MFSLILLWIGALILLFRSRGNLELENLVLRQQLAVLKRRHRRPSIGPLDKLFWVVVRRFWSGWKQALIVVTPETVARWHRTGFRMYWRLISRVRTQVGRRRTPKEVRELIFQMVAENPSWGVPRIHGELLMLGFDLSERTISRWMKRAPRDPDPAKCLTDEGRPLEQPTRPQIWKVLSPSIACIRRIAYPVRAEATKHVLPGSTSLGRPAKLAAVGAIWETSKLGGLNVRNVRRQPRNLTAENRVRGRNGKPT